MKRKSRKRLDFDLPLGGASPPGVSSLPILSLASNERRTTHRQQRHEVRHALRLIAVHKVESDRYDELIDEAA